MAARSPRRSFATPFVVTLAGSAALAACFVEPAARPSQPQPAIAPTATEPAPTIAPATPPPTPAPTVVANPPRPQPGPAVAQTDRKWTIRKAGDKCQAFSNTACPQVPNGQPVPTCNPPPPVAYACPDGSVNGDTVNVVQLAGHSECQIDFGPISCPKGAMCNPPPPRKVACPQ